MSVARTFGDNDEGMLGGLKCGVRLLGRPSCRRRQISDGECTFLDARRLWWGIYRRLYAAILDPQECLRRIVTHAPKTLFNVLVQDSIG
jgi:hypothetical protein